MQHAAIQQQRPFTAAVRRAAGSATRLRAGGKGAAPPTTAQLAEGARVKVKAPVKVYHVGKYKAGLELEGMEGTVVQPNVCDYKHHDGKKHDLSATLPVKVQFMVPAPDGGKDVKVLVHLVSSLAGVADDEVEAV
ncbi:hypothetical protein CHLNCDRAFT_140698 [Chlorella variabilis]|uniref:Ferredoxin thioredoxin reductase alpha chain domain-containing protein n=1 Tax=Chlorella variabilis TaxID=554065 RepID=E1Z601_CHLVA|nr:hypothetical protein CHLNCDRAFT_140698 [Chlorella variabilis]EFN58845.1 hypothetical protein CHLNCDRAFT_140698 [Chlorella variabilis]|eukprot:XP_005850947.1 hypothetical protein CHLNCDRAFT_140698 [Chlorella variabilis]